VKRTKRRMINGLLILGTAALLWLAEGCGESTKPKGTEPPGAGPPAGAEVATVEERTAPAFEWASGAIASARQTSVASRILARVEEVRVRAGSRVEQGDVLVVFDARDLKARVQETRQDLKAARARLELARNDKERIERLYKEGIATKQDLDKAVSDLEVADSDVKGIERRIEETRAAESHAVIRSPVSGRVVDRLVEPGDTPVPGRPLLQIYDPTALRVDVPVRESLAVHLSIGQTVRVEIPALGETLEGTIDEIVPFSEPGARTLLVKVRLPLHPRLFAGMFARVAIPAGERTRLLAPPEAVERIGQLEFVDVLGADGRVERRVVTTARRNEDGRIEVLSGLQAGERIRLPATPAPPPGEEAP
jgi:membrane fusion protein (multidrug efflux system)